MDKLKYIKLENEDGSYSESIPLSVDSDYVEVNGNSLTNELASKATKNDIVNCNNKIDIEKIRIDNLTHLTEGSTTGDAELIDTRVMFNGTIASSAGDAVRETANFLNDKILNINQQNKENLIKNYYGLDGYKNSSFSNGASGNGLLTGFTIPSGSSGFASFICFFLNFRNNSRLERYIGKKIKFTLKYQYFGDNLYSDASATQLKLRSWDGLNTYTTVYSDQSSVVSEVEGNTITKSLIYTIPENTKFLGSLFQLMSQTQVGENTTINVIENSYELVNETMTDNTNNLIEFLEDRNLETNLTIKQDGTGDFYRLIDCFNYINLSGKNNANNIFNVYIYSGTYNLINEQGGTNWLNNVSLSNGERQGLTIPSYVRLIGIGNVVIECKIPESITNSDAFRCVSLFNCKQWNEIYNIKMISQNVRYTIHDEASGDFNKSHRVWKNCTFERLTGRTDIFSTTNYGGGLGSGGTYEFENCIFLNDGTNLFIHNNNNIEPNTIIVDGCYLKSNIYGHSINFGYLGTNTYNSIAIVKNCMYNDVANIAIAEDSDNAWSIYNFVDQTVSISGITN